MPDISECGIMGILVAPFIVGIHYQRSEVSIIIITPKGQMRGLHLILLRYMCPCTRTGVHTCKSYDNGVHAWDGKKRKSCERMRAGPCMMCTCAIPVHCARG